jgi:hypothetical protein
MSPCCSLSGHSAMALLGGHAGLELLQFLARAEVGGAEGAEGQPAGSNCCSVIFAGNEALMLPPPC